MEKDTSVFIQLAITIHQEHPCQDKDYRRVKEILTCKIPTAENLVDVARLLIRYEGFPGAYQLQKDLLKILNLWKMNREELNKMTRQLWQSGNVLETKVEDDVGSAFDTADTNTDDTL